MGIPTNGKGQAYPVNRPTAVPSAGASTKQIAP